VHVFDIAGFETHDGVEPGSIAHECMQGGAALGTRYEVIDTAVFEKEAEPLGGKAGVEGYINSACG
jgi:hypothetical protein